MRYASVSNLWSRIARRRPPQGHARREEHERELDRALVEFRRAPVRVPPWERIEQVIQQTAKEQVMTPISRATILGVSRRVAWIAATSAAVLVACFTVPFSQTNPVGASVRFDFSPPLASNALDQALGNCTGEVFDHAQFGITNCNVQVEKTDEGWTRVEFLVLTETGIVPDQFVQSLTSRYPDLANAQVTVTPIEERSTGTVFDNFAGTSKLTLQCEGKTADQIAAEIKAQMAARGVPNAQVEVTKDGDDGPVKVRVCVKDTATQK